MRPVAGHVELAGAVRVLAAVLAAYLIIGQPIVGGWSQRRFRRALRRDPRARLLRYRRTTLLEWSAVGVALLLVAAAPGLDLADIGVRWPRLAGGGAPYTVVGALGLLFSVVLLVALRRRVEQGAEVAAPGEVVALLPRTVRERRAFAALAVTAGVCEETLYRGVLLALAGALRPEPGPAKLVLLSALAFGLAHNYQGGAGVVVTAVLGGCLTVLYLGSGSLLLPVLYHVLVDLRVLVLAADRPQHRRGQHPRHQAGG
ncbi:MAG: protease family protein [Mycobacteriales bacterium]